MEDRPLITLTESQLSNENQVTTIIDNIKNKLRLHQISPNG